MADLATFAPQGVNLPGPFGGVGAGFLQAGAAIGNALFRGPGAPFADSDDSIFLNLLQQSQSDALLTGLSNEELDIQIGSEIDADRPVIRGTADEIAEAQLDVQNVLARFVDSSGNLPPGFNPRLIPIFEVIGEPPPEITPEVSILDSEVGTVVEIPDVGEPEFIDLDTDAGTDESVPVASVDPRLPRVDLGNLQMALDLGNILRGTAVDLGRRLIGSIDFDPATPGLGGTTFPSAPDIIGGFFDVGTLAPTTPTTGVTNPPVPVDLTPTPDIDESLIGVPVAGTAVVSRRDAAVAARLGLTPQQVAQARILCRAIGRRRRKRMLTKSDIADISTMASLLGKNSEAFKTWLAKATR